MIPHKKKPVYCLIRLDMPNAHYQGSSWSYYLSRVPTCGRSSDMAFLLRMLGLAITGEGWGQTVGVLGCFSLPPPDPDPAGPEGV